MWLRLAVTLADLSPAVLFRVPLMALWVTGSIPILANLFFSRRITTTVKDNEKRTSHGNIDT
uniref:Uncharacterized protein n=1 Tax=Oryza nivara TaxID=4536 RepID=A0A0E0IC86_ORYNI